MAFAKSLLGISIAIFSLPAYAQTCEVALTNANVWNGSSYQKQTLAIRGGQFVVADEALPKVDASPLFLIPPFADGHTHAIDMAKAGNATHKKSIAQGIFYALNPNNIRPQGATPAASAGLVELQAAGGGVTRPGGHPEPLYTGLAQRGWLGSLKVADLPGKAFHTATTIAEAKAAVAAVKANGAVMIKLYLLDHDKPTSNGLSGPVFDAAVAEAKRLGLRPIVHVESAADYRRAIAQGVHAIVHLPYALSNDRKPEEMMLTSQDAAATAKAGTIIVPTATVALASNDGEELRKIRAIQLNNLTLLRDAGVIMAVGADNFTLDMHDEINTLRSFGIFEGSDIIAMATVNGAKLAFPDRKIGQFEAGYEASFIGYFAPLPGNWADQRNPVIGMRAGSVMIDTVDWLSKSCPKQPNG
jgi:cytosine/adenosine deaminase-related metal-dependent hydrolase